MWIANQHQKLPQAHQYAQDLPNLSTLWSFQFVDVVNIQSFMDKLNDMSYSNINKHHWKTIDYYFCSI